MASGAQWRSPTTDAREACLRRYPVSPYIRQHPAPGISGKQSRTALTGFSLALLRRRGIRDRLAAASVIFKQAAKEISLGAKTTSWQKTLASAFKYVSQKPCRERPFDKH
jgi:hypothetical protein